MIHCDSALEEFQKLNTRIYWLINDRSYSVLEIFSRLHRHTAQILKGVRKAKNEDVEYHLCMAFSWSMALANRFHFDVADEMWERFPGHCPYCWTVPCSCSNERARDRRELTGKPIRERPGTLREWQGMFADIYPNIVQNSAMHLSEEAGEVDEAIRVYLATHEDDSFSKIVEELVDVVTNIFGVANCLRFDLAAGLAEYFPETCPGCLKSPCACGYVTTDHTIHIRKKNS